MILSYQLFYRPPSINGDDNCAMNEGTCEMF